jgi:hypothetical protein
MGPGPLPGPEQDAGDDQPRTGLKSSPAGHPDHVNGTGETVIFGGGYTQELCYLGLYRYSLDSTLGDLFECLSH